MKPSFAPAIARPAPKPAPASRSAAAMVPRFVSTPLGAGAPLSSSVRPRLEHSFGADLGGVRVHTESSASRVADAVGARAFAFGGDIVLSSRASANDLGLMAHETAHVLQQNGGPARVQAFGGALGCGYEREAHSASAAAMRGERYRIALFTGGPYPQFGFWSSLVSTVTEGIGGLIDKAVAYIRDNARSIPGYDLLAVAIGKDPLTQQTVDRSAANIIKGLMGLVPGGVAMFENIQKAGVIQRAADWVDSELKRLNLSWDRVKTTISEFIGTLGAKDLLDLGGVFMRAKRIFGPLVGDVVTFAKGAAAKLFEFIFEGALALAGSAGQQVLAIIRKAGAVVKQIIEDPVGFLKNLLAAVFGGFQQFGANILTHLKNAIFDWLFGAMAGAGIQLPKKFDLKGILSVVLQVLGLTWQNMRGKLVKVLGEPVVAGLEKTFEFIKLIATEGIGAAWQKILEFASGITDTVIEGIKSWVKTTIVGQAVMKLVSMANPVGAIIQSIIAIYNTVMFVIERAKQIMAFVNAVTDSIANIAAGRISAAINYVEQTLAKILPLVISFLARFIGLGGISAKIKDIIAKIRAPIDKAIDRIVDWLAVQAKNLAKAAQSGARSASGAVLGWLGLRKGFRDAAGKPHTLLFAGDGAGARLVFQSATTELEAFLDNLPSPRSNKTKEIKDLVAEVNRFRNTPGNESRIENAMAAISEKLGDLVGAGRFGTADQPLPMSYPKRNASAYPVLYFGPWTTQSVDVSQNLLRGAKDEPLTVNKRPGPKRAAILAKLGDRQRSTWESDAFKIDEYRPTSRKALPAGGQTIGISGEYQTAVGLKFELKPGSTTGAATFNDELKKYGFWPSSEGMDGDHVVEMQLGGPNDFKNLWPLDSAENQESGRQISVMEIAKPDGTKIVMPDLKALAKTRPVWLFLAKTLK